MSENTEIKGICCFCQEDCNPLSQSCSLCKRRWIYIDNYTHTENEEKEENDEDEENEEENKEED